MQWFEGLLTAWTEWSVTASAVCGFVARIGNPVLKSSSLREKLVPVIRMWQQDTERCICIQCIALLNTSVTRDSKHTLLPVLNVFLSLDCFVFFNSEP